MSRPAAKKFGRERDQRRAMVKSLAESLIIQGSLVTTKPKAKAAAVYTEKLITRAKKGGLSSRRLVISRLNTLEAAHKLFDEIAPKLSARGSGYLRVKREGWRRGDNTELSRVSFVDDLKNLKAEAPKSASEAEKKQKSDESKDKSSNKPTANSARSNTKPQTGRVTAQAPKRTGRRGDR